MAEFTFADLIQSAADAPSSGVVRTPDLDRPGKYRVEVTHAKADETSNGKLRVGIKYVVLDGPQQGHGIWGNQILSPESPAALDIFFRTFEALGIPRDAWAKYGEDVTLAGEAVAEAVVGARATITVKMGQARGGYDARLEVKFVDPLSSTAAPAAARTAVAPGPQIPAQPAAPRVTPPAPPVPATSGVTPPRAPF